MAVDAYLERLAAALLGELGDAGFVLAGAGAIREHGLTDRPTHDIDLFAHSTLTATQFADALTRAQDLLTGLGLEVELVRSYPDSTMMDSTGTCSPSSLLAWSTSQQATQRSTVSAPIASTW